MRRQRRDERRQSAGSAAASAASATDRSMPSARPSNVGLGADVDAEQAGRSGADPRPGESTTCAASAVQPPDQARAEPEVLPSSMSPKSSRLSAPLRSSASSAACGSGASVNTVGMPSSVRLRRREAADVGLAGAADQRGGARSSGGCRAGRRPGGQASAAPTAGLSSGTVASWWPAPDRSESNAAVDGAPGQGADPGEPGSVATRREGTSSVAMPPLSPAPARLSCRSRSACRRAGRRSDPAPYDRRPASRPGRRPRASRRRRVHTTAASSSRPSPRRPGCPGGHRARRARIRTRSHGGVQGDLLTARSARSPATTRASPPAGEDQGSRSAARATSRRRRGRRCAGR